MTFIFIWGLSTTTSALCLSCILWQSEVLPKGWAGRREMVRLATMHQFRQGGKALENRFRVSERRLLEGLNREPREQNSQRKTVPREDI